MAHFKARVKLVGHSVLLFSLIAMGSMAPVTAQGTEDGITSDQKFCTTVSEGQQHISEAIIEAQSSQRALWQTQNEHLNLMKKQFTADLQQLQSEIDAAHQKNVETMHIAHVSSADSKSITQYAERADAINTSRRQNVVAAQQIFEHAFAASLTNRQTVRAGQSEAFRIAVDDALHAAAVSCQDDPSTTTARVTLLKQLATARKVYTHSLQTNEAATGQLLVYLRQRDTAIDSANEAAMKQLDAAAVSLNNAFMTMK